MFVKVINNQVSQYPYTVGDLRRDNPNTSFPKTVSEATMSDFGMFPVGYEGAPEYDPMTHRLEHNDVPVLKDGNWVLVKTVVALTDQQTADRTAAKANEVRSKRGRLLSDTDWTQVADAPVDQSAWAAYRQELRDITTQDGFPYSVDWPTEPTA